jgi:hypothetical protein
MFSGAEALDAFETVARKSTRQSFVRINKPALQEIPFINSSNYVTACSSRLARSTYSSAKRSGFLV